MWTVAVVRNKYPIFPTNLLFFLPSVCASLYFSVSLFYLFPLFLHQRVSLEFYIDVHAHSTMLNGFMYGNVFEDEERVQRQAVFPRLLCQNAPDFSFVSHANRHTQTHQKGGDESGISPIFNPRASSEREHEIVLSQQLLVRWCSASHLIANCCTLSGTQLKTSVALGIKVKGKVKNPA